MSSTAARLRRNWPHLLIWAAMAAFTIFAPALHYRWFTAEGRSTEFTGPLPKATSKGDFQIQELSTVTRLGEPLYRLTGWAYIRLDPRLTPADYTRRLLLHSEARSYVYPITQVIRPKLNKVIEDSPVDLKTAGFYASIAVDSLKPGSYRVSLLFTHPSGKTYLLRTGRTIVRTLNTVEMK